MLIIHTTEQITAGFSDLLAGLAEARHDRRRLRRGHLAAPTIKATAFVPFDVGGRENDPDRRKRKDVLSVGIVDWSLDWHADGRFVGAFTLPEGHVLRDALQGGVGVLHLARYRNPERPLTQWNEVYSDLVEDGVVRFDFEGPVAPERTTSIGPDWIGELRLYAPTWSTAARE